MRKTYRMFLALAVMLLCATNVKAAGELISLEEVPFWQHEAGLWGLNAAKNVEMAKSAEGPCLWVVGASCGQPYGDSAVNGFADLSLYTKLIVEVTEGTPRFLFNRDVDEGQWNADQSLSHLIDNTKDGWSNKYFSDNGEGTWTVNLQQMVKDFGFCHLHAIKGANWANVTVTSMMVETSGKKQQIGWINLINNSNMEGDDVSSFFTRIYPDASMPVPNSEIVDGAGKDGSRGIIVATVDKVQNPWDNQFFFRFNEALKPGDKYKVSFDYRADEDAGADTQSHREPGDYIYYDLWGKINFTTQWQNFSKEGEVTDQLYGPSQTANDYGFLSVAFNLNDDSHPTANKYYFDNIKFEVYKAGIVAEYNLDMIKVDFGFETNMMELVKANGKPRVIFPKDMVSVTQNGEEKEVMSVEGFADGRFYIFMQEALDDTAPVNVKITNPTEARYHLVYTTGPGGDVPNFDDVAEMNGDVGQLEDEFAYNFVTPIVVSSDPEDGSFNLPNNINTFKVTFDKLTDCAALVAKLDNTNLTKTPADGFAEEITLTYNGAELTNGSHTIKLDKVYPDERLDDGIFGTYTITISTGKIEPDPNDKEELIYEAKFSDQEENPGAGWIVNNGDEAGTMQAANSGAGCRLMHGYTSSFTPDILYLSQRSTPGGGVGFYGTQDGYKLNLQAKNYHLTFGAAMWDGDKAPRTLKVQVLPEAAINPENGAILDETQILVEEMKAIEPDYKTSAEATRFDVVIPVKEEGNYVIRFVPGNSQGNPAGFSDASAIGDVKVEYLPNAAGLEWLRMFNTAMESAKTIHMENDDARHHGPAFDDLDAAIKKYEAEYLDYTAPSQFTNAVADLNAKADIMKAHGKLINEYDPLPAQAQEIIDNRAGGKFEKTELYQNLKDVAAKYVILKEEKVVDPETGEEVLATVAYPKELTEDAELQAAIDELKNMVATAQYFFTEGESKTSSDVGIKVLVDRIRQGVEGLVALGVSEADELIVRANDAVTDDDEIAEELKKRLTLEFYKKQAAGENLFPETVDETTLETTTTTYNFTAFLKNPNTYCWLSTAGVNDENCPGWNVLTGNPGLTDMWNGNYPKNADGTEIIGLPKDLCITAYHNECRMEQTIYDLPAGVYNVMIDATEWSDEFSPKDGDSEETIAQKEANHKLSRAYVKTSATPVFEGEGEEQFAADSVLSYRGQYVGRFENHLNNIEVVDGELTLGVKWNGLAQFMFDRVQLFLSGAAAGFDYAAGYQEVLAGIDAQAVKPAKVRAIKVYDMNGRLIPSAKKGVNIVKKYLDNGQVVTTKVIK